MFRIPDTATHARRPAVELVVLLASAGGLDALSIVLRDLATEFPAAEVVEQHLAGLSSVLPTILGRQTPHRVSWGQDGQAVVPGEVVVGPPGIHLELTPDCRCRLRETEALGERRFDVLLASVARSWGARSADLVLPIHEIGRVLAEIVAGRTATQAAAARKGLGRNAAGATARRRRRPRSNGTTNT
jgi:chemotaxis response regulator CheB